MAPLFLDAADMSPDPPALLPSPPPQPPPTHRLSSSSLPPYCCRTRSNSGRVSSLATCGLV